MVVRGLGKREGGNGESLFNAYRVSVADNKKVLEMAGGDGEST